MKCDGPESVVPRRLQRMRGLQRISGHYLPLPVVYKRIHRLNSTAH
jgi:hypothetical protein